LSGASRIWPYIHINAYARTQQRSERNRNRHARMEFWMRDSGDRHFLRKLACMLISLPISNLTRSKGETRTHHVRSFFGRLAWATLSNHESWQLSTLHTTCTHTRLTLAKASHTHMCVPAVFLSYKYPPPVTLLLHLIYDSSTSKHHATNLFRL
jgi:hypothetical protein